MRENKTDRETDKGRGRKGGRERREETDKLTIVIACTTLQLMSVDL